MKRKATDKLFHLVYTDMMTGTYNRNAYEERIEKLNRGNAQLDSITVVAIRLDNIGEIKRIFGNRTADEAIRLAASCALNTIGEKADVYRLSEDEFLCIAYGNVMGYISELRDLIGFESTDKKIPLNARISYMSFDNKKHKNFDELIKDCDKHLLKTRNRTLV